MIKVPIQVLWQKYQVVRVLGKGSFGKVFLVRDTQNNSEYAMKKYSKYHLTTNGKQRSLIRSIRILSTLSHRNIIKLKQYTFSLTEDSMFLMFQPCKKGSLQQLKNIIVKTQDIDIIVSVIFQLVQGLQYLKNMSVAHRDIKPSNIAFNSQGQLKIIDFDEAICFKTIQSSENKQQINFPFSQEPIAQVFISRRSQANTFVGTQNYMAPEMKFTTKADERVDIWALGCILFQMAFNQSLQLIYDDQEDLSEQVQKKLGYIRRSNKKVNFDCLNLLEKILVIDPDKRMSIKQIIAHSFFTQIRQKQGYRNYCQQKLKRLLRGNHCIFDPDSIYDALQIDLIGMKDGLERCQMLKTVVYFKKENDYMLYFLAGGGKYFKLFSVSNESQKIYIWYDSIKQIVIKDQHIYLKVEAEVWSRQINNFEIIMKHLYPEMLGRLFDMMNYILKD